MSNPEKRDERSMSDILASIRKIMAQEPALAMPPNPPRPSLNGVGGGTLDLPREPELKLPTEKKPSEGASPPSAPAVGPEPVSLDELLAETPRTAPPPPAVPTAKPAAGPAGAPTPPSAAPEWLFPKPNAGELPKDKPAPAPAKDIEAKSPASPASVAPSAGSAGKAEVSEGPKAAKEPPPSSPVIGPPAPRLGDLGSVVPSKLDGAGSQPALAAGAPTPSAAGERHVLGPPSAGPLLGEAARAPAASEPLPEVPGADALRRLIANVVPPSAHPSLAPAAKAPEAAPAKTAEAPKPAPETKVEAKSAPTVPSPEAKKPETVTPAPAPAAASDTKPATPAVKPAAAASAPAPKPAAPVPAVQKTEAPVQAPAAKPAGQAAAKTLDETVVELLRPLLREWLNTNMPRLIEPALKAEIEALRNVVAKEKKD
ncbi:MAG TPA: DUF2497 domain-containing protein [Hyphomicrobiaceae bacterium]|jgi:Meckel syndrome type 1 protein|nr:DUF2497 domain-containing protein [Hyphomicrobiaceae bacterium]